MNSEINSMCSPINWTNKIAALPIMATREQRSAYYRTGKKKKDQTHQALWQALGLLFFLNFCFYMKF
jgi:hypothetical protein